MDTLGQIGEHAAIERLAATLGTHPDLRIGAGDDCAVASLPGTETDQVFTTDPIIENIHFLPTDLPERIGNKAAGRVFSDIAAMGAQPQWLLVNVVAPPRQEVGMLEKIYDGINALCHRFGATLIGGDLAQGTCLELHVFGTGTLPAGTALLRSGAQMGDAIFTTGPLGCSLQGRHLDFVPRVEEGLFLRESGHVHAMMDISDGLATDLRHILRASGIGAVLDADAIPKNGTLENALYDGEDFELLFTASAPDAATLQAQWAKRFGTPLSAIGQITDRKNKLCIRHTDGAAHVLEDKAFEHFKPKTDGTNNE
jgi:thiamine-monophosphate kinase